MNTHKHKWFLLTDAVFGEIQAQCVLPNCSEKLTLEQIIERLNRAPDANHCLECGMRLQDGRCPAEVLSGHPKLNKE